MTDIAAYVRDTLMALADIDPEKALTISAQIASDMMHVRNRCGLDYHEAARCVFMTIQAELVKDRQVMFMRVCASCDESYGTREPDQMICDDCLPDDGEDVAPAVH